MINKKLMAVAVAGALAAPGLAVAQATASGTNVQIYGLFDMAVRQDRYTNSVAGTTVGGVTTPSGGDMTKYHMHNGAPNRLGFRGTENLGAGLTAFFQVETQVMLDARPDANGGAATNAVLGGRPTFVGLRGASWGEVSVGYQEAVYQDVYTQGWSVTPTQGHFGIIMNNGNTSGQPPAPPVCSATQASGLAAAPSAANPLCGIEAGGTATSFMRRMSDTVVYRSPVIAGARFSTMLYIPELKQNPNDANRVGSTQLKQGFSSFSLTWSGGPFSVAAGYEQHNGFRAVSGTGVAGVGTQPNSKDKGFELGARWNYGRGLIGAGWEKLKYENSNTAAASNQFDIVNWTVQGTFNVTPADVAAVGYSQTPGATNCGTAFTTAATATASAGVLPAAAGSAGNAACGGAGKAKMWTVTFDHNFSKRTGVYAQYSKIDNGSGSNYYYIAGPTTNNGTGASGAMAQGTDVTTLGVGIKHTF